MIELKEITAEESKSYTNIFLKSCELLGDYAGLFFKIIINGEERILQKDDNLYVLYKLENNEVSYELFNVNEDNKIQTAVIEDYEIYDVFGDTYFSKKNTSMYYYLKHFKRQNGIDNDGYNGLIGFSQYNSETDVRVMITYQQNVIDENKPSHIYPYHIEKPFEYLIETHAIKRDKGYKFIGSKKQYLKTEYSLSKDPYYYNVVTIKEYGLINFLQQGSYSLQKEKNIHRYSKTLWQRKDYQSVSCFPFCKIYRQEDMEEKLSKLGYKTSIPEFLIKYYNGEMNSTLNMYQEVADYMKEILDESEIDVVYLKLEKSDQNKKDSAN